jgi:hypothetical protein
MPSASIDNLPVNGRNYIRFTTTDSQVVRDNAPSTGPAASAALKIKGRRARSNVVSVDGADATDNSVNGIRTPESQIAASGSVSPEKSPLADATSDETAKELFRLGTVQAPPYTFSGFASAAAHDTDMDAGGLAGKPRKSPIDQARPFFRDAMDAYVAQRYSDASDLLEKAAQTEPNAADVNFYLGVCRLLQGRPGDSIAPLNSILSDETSPWAQAAHFYLAKAYIQTGDLARAETQLHAAADMPGRLKAEAGSELARLQTVRAEEQQHHPVVEKP